MHMPVDYVWTHELFAPAYEIDGRFRIRQTFREFGRDQGLPRRCCRRYWVGVIPVARRKARLNGPMEP